MLALSPPGIREDGGGRMEEFPAGSACHHQFTDLGDGDLLDCIDFDDLFMEIEGDGELLPDLEMADPDTVAEFSALSGGEESEMSVPEVLDRVENGSSINESGKVDPAVSKGADEGGGGGGKKSSVHSKNSHPQGKRKVKVKVDWTPELHRRFVKAVEQLGLDKAVPSKILEIMGVDCLTRHNIASHLQKYRFQRKHLLAREAEAASWNHQRRQMHIGGMAEPSPWLINGPAMGFPPPMAPRPVQPLFRPLQVWGHPSADQPAWHSHVVHLLPPAPPPRPVWSPVYPPYNSLPPPFAPPPVDHNTYWNIHHHQVPNAVTPGTPYFPQPLAVTGFMSGRLVPGIFPSAMHRVDPGIGVPAGQPGAQPPPEFHRSRDPIDAAMGDILTKPWQPLPVGLKPPSLDGVLAELHRQGIPNIPPSSLC